MIKKRMVDKPPEDMPRYYKRIKEYFDIIMIHSSLAVGQFFPINRRLLVATDFDEKLHHYFSGDDSDLEVRIVRFVQQTIKEVKIAEKYFAGNPGIYFLM